VLKQNPTLVSSAHLLCLRLDVFRREKVGLVVQVQLADHEHVGDARDVAVGHAHAGPD